jgi:tetratricopeptide (TPR) repeat protein
MHQKARLYAIAAGDAARERMGFADAKELYERALRLWGEGDEQGRLDLLMKLSWAALLTSDISAARISLIEAEAGWRALGNDRQAGLALAMLGRGYFFSGETERATEALQQAIDLLEGEGPTPELIRALVWFSILSIVSGRAEEGAALSRKGLDMAQALGIDEARSDLLTSLGSFEVMMGDPTGVDRIREGLDIAERAKDIEAIGRAYVNIPVALSELSEDAEGVAFCRLGREVMRKLGSAAFEWSIAAKEAELLFDLGRYGEAEELSREVLGPYRAVIVAPSLVWAGSTLALILARRGRPEQARQQIDPILPIARRVGGSMFLPAALIAEAELEEGRGNVAAAAVSMREVLEILMDTSAVAHQYRAIVPAARLVPEEAGPLLNRVQGLESHQSFQARVAEARGCLSGDRKLLATAADLYGALALPYQEARCRMDLEQWDRAAELIERLGIWEGPMGVRLRTVAGR